MKPKSHILRLLNGRLYTACAFTFGHLSGYISLPVAFARLTLWLFDHSYQWRTAFRCWDPDPDESMEGVNASFAEAQDWEADLCFDHGWHPDDLRIIRSEHCCWEVQVRGLAGDELPF